ncbi:hypothetical protein U1E44_01515 [Arenibacter sp. GZD96]|uniref:hypothetical protein n=1 Tax=Aurantibrevibacter litoralis TaxID=3106030 RepID=UPI002AFEBDA7|nr:hypothetical protein [Arenibacter sp. GZD-96]MEA1784757.1 hypothetical protein [Arenibacter sp. GZD-96]
MNKKIYTKQLKLLILFVLIFLFGCSHKLHRNQTITLVDIIPFKLSTYNNIVVEAVLNTTDTVNLMFHTAANSASVIKSSSERLNSITWTNETAVSASWGGNGVSRYSQANTLKIGNMVFDSLSIWENEKSGPGTDGKFGINLFDDYVVEINFDESLIKLHHTLPNTEDYIKMNLDNKDGLLFITGTSRIDSSDYDNPFLIHSGYSGALLFDDKFSNETQMGQYIKITSEEVLKDSFGNILKTKKGILPKFSLGEMQFFDVPVGFFEGTIGKQKMSVMGGDMIKRFNIIFDKDSAAIYLKANSLMNERFN